MILQALSSVYGAATTWRRHWYARDPSRRRALSRPVVSVGNLRVGGSGKTPIVEVVARLLRDNGHRPAILTRGYGRRVKDSGVTVVSDGAAILAGLAHSGDEPLMLARALPDVPVLVAADRYLAGVLAERKLGATVHVLDDGFQHMALARDVDLLLVDESDLADKPFPEGHLREPLASARAADAVLVNAGYTTASERIARALGVGTAFRVTRALSAPHTISTGDSVVVPSGARIFAMAAIARPDRFVADLTSVGWQVVGSRMFRDHHHYTRADIRRVAAEAKACAAAIILTTGKDAVRLDGVEIDGIPLAAVPLAVEIDPADGFRQWLLAKL